MARPNRLLLVALLSLVVSPKVSLTAPSDKDASTTDAKPPARKSGGGKGQAEELSYTVPAGWERSEQERIVVLTPPGVPPTKCALIITPGENLNEDFLKWFKTRWDALRKGAKVVQGGDRTGQDGPDGSSVLYQAALLESQSEGGAKRRTGLLLYAVHVGSAVHWVVFKTNGPELFNKHKKTVNQFLAGMKFIEIRPAPPGEKGGGNPKSGPAKTPKAAKRPPAEGAGESRP